MEPDVSRREKEATFASRAPLLPPPAFAQTLHCRGFAAYRVMELRQQFPPAQVLRGAKKCRRGRVWAIRCENLTDCDAALQQTRPSRAGTASATALRCSPDERR